MDNFQLQMRLALSRRYNGAIDGIWGPKQDAAVLLLFRDGPDTALTALDFNDAADRLQVQPAAIRAFWATEAAGAGFQDGAPKILPERHRFSKATGGRFDKTNPTLSAPSWDRTWYPRTQSARYDVILEWGRLLSRVKMPIDAAFGSASYGGPQIMGENAPSCWCASAIDLAEWSAHDERSQLLLFEAFVTNAGILPFLRRVNRTESSWDPVSLRYNGTAFRQNGYSGKMLANFIKFGGK